MGVKVDLDHGGRYFRFRAIFYKGNVFPWFDR
jgi:hypothetical protein